MELRLVESAAELERMSALFDEPALPDASERFVATAGHFIVVAYEDDEPVGFVSGVELIHPDKGAEMFLYELGVHDGFRGRGIATALVARLRDVATERGCYAMWVLTDRENTAALATYQRAGASEPRDHVLLEWKLTGSN